MPGAYGTTRSTADTRDRNSTDAYTHGLYLPASPSHASAPKMNGERRVGEWSDERRVTGTATTRLTAAGISENAMRICSGQMEEPMRGGDRSDHQSLLCRRYKTARPHCAAARPRRSAAPPPPVGPHRRSPLRGAATTPRFFRASSAPAPRARGYAAHARTEARRADKVG